MHFNRRLKYSLENQTDASQRKSVFFFFFIVVRAIAPSSSSTNPSSLAKQYNFAKIPLRREHSARPTRNVHILFAYRERARGRQWIWRRSAGTPAYIST